MNRYAQRVEELTDSYAKESNAKRSKTLTEEELQAVEREIGHVLPADYREFLRDYSGMTFSGNQCRRAALYHLWHYQSGRASISYALDNIALVETWKSLRGYTPEDLLFFGGDGNVQLFIAIDGEHVGSIYQFYPDPYPENLYYYPELELVARSFDDFIHSLKPLKGQFYDDPSYYEQEQQEISRVVEELARAVPRADSVYKQVLLSANGRYVYSSLGEDACVLSESDLERLEQEIGSTLPGGYKKFIIDCGGYSFLPSLDRGDIYRPSSTYPNTSNKLLNELNRVKGFYEEIAFFHGWMPKDYHDLVGHYQRLKSFLPVGFLPIADAGQICLVLEGSNKGSVYKAPREVTEFSVCPSYCGPSTPLDFDSLEFLASSFDDFIRSIRSNLLPGSYVV